jgi:enterochelin esterase-like enzyme
MQLVAFVAVLTIVVSGCVPIQPPAVEVPEAQVVPTATEAPAATEAPTEVAAAPAAEPTRAPDVRMTFIKHSITSPALEGNLLGDPATRPLNVLLPPGYEGSDRRYPVLYALPWAEGEATMNTEYFKGTFERLPGEVRDMIIVLPDGTNALGGGQFRSSPTIGDYETYVTRDLVDFVDSNYRTLATRDSRGLAGCANAGTNAMRLGLMYPEVFSVVAATGGVYDDTPWQLDLESIAQASELPQDPAELKQMDWDAIAWYSRLAASAAPNPDNPPFYFDVPFRLADGKVEQVPEVMEKIMEQDPVHQLDAYLAQPERLNAILLLTGTRDEPDTTRVARAFDALLTSSGVEHTYVEKDDRFCPWAWEEDTLRFMGEHLVFEEP